MVYMMKNKNVIIIGIISILFVAGVLLVYNFLLWNMAKNIDDKSNQIFEELILQGRNLLQDDPEEAISVFKHATEVAENPPERAVAQYQLGVATIPVDVVRGINILKNVSENEIYPVSQRAFAVNAILARVLRDIDRELMDEVVFTGTLWESFIEMKEDRTRNYYINGIKKAYEFSINLETTFIAEYWLANWYAASSRSKNINSTTKQTLIFQATKHLEAGDAIFISPEKSSRFTPFVMGKGLTLKGLALSELFIDDTTANKASDREKTVNVFTEALRVLDSVADDKAAQSLIDFTRFYFAAFLARSADEINREKGIEIQNILAPIYEKRGQVVSFYSFLSRQATGKENIRFKGEIVLLSKIDARFKNLLLALGWKKDQLR